MIATIEADARAAHHVGATPSLFKFPLPIFCFLSLLVQNSSHLSLHSLRCVRFYIPLICVLLSAASLPSVFLHVSIWFSDFYPRDAMLARVLAMALCLSVCVCRKSVFYRNGWTIWPGFWHGSFLPPILHCVKRNLCYLQNKGTSLWNSVPNSGLRKFCRGMSIAERAVRLARERWTLKAW